MCWVIMNHALCILTISRLSNGFKASDFQSIFYMVLCFSVEKWTHSENVFSGGNFELKMYVRRRNLYSNVNLLRFYDASTYLCHSDILIMPITELIICYISFYLRCEIFDFFTGLWICSFDIHNCVVLCLLYFCIKLSAKFNLELYQIPLQLQYILL